MKHVLIPKKQDESIYYSQITIEQEGNEINIEVAKIDVMMPADKGGMAVNLNKEELHSFIGTLLHIQQKMK